MSTTGQGVQWVPGMSEFVVNWSTDLKLYQISVVQREIKSKSSHVVTSPALKSQLRCRISESPHYTKCAAVSPMLKDQFSPQNSSPSAAIEASNIVSTFTQNDIKVAVGQANGRINLLSFHGGGTTLKEFGPKIGRSCNDLAWNPFNQHFLAAAYDKNRNDSAILIFDTSIAPPNSVTIEQPSAIGKLTSSKPKITKDFIGASIEIGLGETCHSLAWFNKSENTFVAGMNMKNLKIFDLRLNESQGPKVMKTNVTRLTFGLCIDPHMDYRVASYYEDTVVIWDTRNFDKPIWTRSQAGEVTQLAWSPTRSGLLASLLKGSTDTLTLHDIQSWAVMSEDGEPAVTQRVVNVSPLGFPDPIIANETEVEVVEGKDIITSFAWHPMEENLLIGCRKDGRLAEVHVNERIAPSWGARHFLAWPQNGILRNYTKQFFDEQLEDISVKMNVRGPCFQFEEPILRENGAKLPYEITLAFDWLSSCKAAMQDLAFKNQFPRQMTAPGIRNAMGLDRGKDFVLIKSDITYKIWNTGNRDSDQKTQRPKRMFKGDARTRALKLCSWGSDESELRHFTQKLVAKKEYARAATIAVFNLEIKMARQILENVPVDENQNHHWVGLSLSGFSEEKYGEQWRQSAEQTLQKITQPYFRAMFEFLLIMSNWNGSDLETFSAILNEDGLMPTDKIAFACLYLPDEKLSDYINHKWAVTRKNGDISAIYLCGASSPESLELLQNYVDITGDVQTASWICVHFMPSEMALNEQGPQKWISSYRSLLNLWSMWESRMLFDNACYTNKVAEPIMQQVYLSCNYCGKPISKYTNGMPDFAIPATNQSSKENKNVQNALNQAGIAKHGQSFMTCPYCRKPSPRCSVCQVYMGTHSGYLAGNFIQSKDGNFSKLTPFGSMFVWCQVCRHGGHAEHIDDWFDAYKECPVAGCNCRCSDLDRDLDAFSDLDIAPAENGENK